MIPHVSSGRPSLILLLPEGLGAETPETSWRSAKKEYRPIISALSSEFQGTSSKLAKKEPLQYASFERYTKGFGSKMMAKMGFVEGMGVGKDSQGMVKPLVLSGSKASKISRIECPETRV